MPGLVWFILVGLLAAAVLGPTMYNRMKTRFNPPPLVAPKTLSNQLALPVLPSSVASGQVLPGQVLPVQSSQAEPVSVFSGCARLREICRCYDNQAQVFDKPDDFCVAHTAPGLTVAGLPAFLEKVPDLVPETQDYSERGLIAYVNRANNQPERLSFK